MELIKGDIWDFHTRGQVVCITTNGFVKTNGECVMGRGTALQAARKFPKLPGELGLLIQSKGNHVHYIPKYRLISFPVKRHWKEDARLDLIERSCKELVQLADCVGNGTFRMNFKYYLPMPGCGNGNLAWYGEVDNLVAKLLDDRFVVVQYDK